MNITVVLPDSFGLATYIAACLFGVGFILFAMGFVGGVSDHGWPWKR